MDGHPVCPGHLTEHGSPTRPTPTSCSRPLSPPDRWPLWWEGGGTGERAGLLSPREVSSKRSGPPNISFSNRMAKRLV